MSLTRIEKYSERGQILKNPPGRLLIVTYWTALGVWLTPGGRRFEPTKSPKWSFFSLFLFFTFFFLERFAVRYAHRRPPYFTQLAEPDPTQVSDLKISHRKLLKKTHAAKEAQGPSCCKPLLGQEGVGSAQKTICYFQLSAYYLCVFRY